MKKQTKKSVKIPNRWHYFFVPTEELNPLLPEDSTLGLCSALYVLRHGADPEHLIATLRGFEHTTDPLLDKTLNLLHNTRGRVDAIFSR